MTEIMFVRDGVAQALNRLGAHWYRLIQRVGDWRVKLARTRLRETERIYAQLQHDTYWRIENGEQLPTKPHVLPSPLEKCLVVDPETPGRPVGALYVEVMHNWRTPDVLHLGADRRPPWRVDKRPRSRG